MILTFVISFGTAQYTAKQEIEDICETKAKQDLNYMLCYIDKELGQAEQAAKTFAATLFENGKYIPDSVELKKKQRLLLEQNPNLSSVIVGYEDRVTDKNGEPTGSGLLSLRKDTALISIPLGKEPDFHKFDWYNIAIHQTGRRWCRPMFSPTGQYAITTYSSPLYNNHDHLVGVIGVSLRLSRLDSILTSLKPYPNAVPSAVLNKDLTYIMHPIKDFVLNMSLQAELETIKETIDDELLTELGARKAGKKKVNWDGKDQTLYFAPVERAECSVMLLVDNNTARQSIAPNARYRIIASLTGLILLLVYISILAIKRKVEIARLQKAKNQ